MKMIIIKLLMNLIHRKKRMKEKMNNKLKIINCKIRMRNLNMNQMVKYLT